MPLIAEIKARCADPDRIRAILESEQARFVGEDHQIDTYFHVPSGRLKLREGTIENHLIFYNRPNQPKPKLSRVHLFKTEPESALKPLLEAAFGVQVIVDKRRSIYYIDNIKFHLDRVQNLGTFVEIEAIDTEGLRTESELHIQCRHYMTRFDIDPDDLIAVSYSDLLLDRAKKADSSS